eukprot:1433735-Rhodomonas_salina.3
MQSTSTGWRQRWRGKKGVRRERERGWQPTEGRSSAERAERRERSEERGARSEERGRQRWECTVPRRFRSRIATQIDRESSPI